MKRTFQMVFVWMAVGVAIIWSVIGFTLIVQFRDLKFQFAELERRMSVTTREVADLQAAVRQNGPQRDAVSPASASQSSIPSLTASDIEIIRQFIKVAPSQSTAQTKLKVGDSFPESSSLPVPKEVSDKLPKLRDARFTIDPSGAIIIGAVGENRVDIVIGMPSAAKIN